MPLFIIGICRKVNGIIDRSVKNARCCLCVMAVAQMIICVQNMIVSKWMHVLMCFVHRRCYIRIWRLIINILK